MVDTLRERRETINTEKEAILGFEHEIYRKSAKKHVSHITAGETDLTLIEM